MSARRWGSLGSGGWCGRRQEGDGEQEIAEGRMGEEAIREAILIIKIASRTNLHVKVATERPEHTHARALFPGVPAALVTRSAALATHRSGTGFDR